MVLRSNLGLVAALVTSAAFLAPAARAGEKCCGGEAAANAPAKKSPADLIVEKETATAKKTEAALAALAAPAAKLSAEDEKAVAEAKKTLVATCPVGKALTTSIPAIAEALEAVRALDMAMAAGGKDLPADCKSKEGGCAFCAEAGGKLPEGAKKLMGIGMGAVERSEKLALALAGIAATYQGATTKPAGNPVAVPSKETYHKLASRIDGIAKDIIAGFAGASKLAEAEKKQLDGATAVLDKHMPGHMKAIFGAWVALFCNLDLARDASAVCGQDMPWAKDPKFMDGLSQNAKNAFALFEARTALVSALGKVGDAGCATACSGEGGGCDEKSKAEKKGCCAEEKKQIGQ